MLCLKRAIGDTIIVDGPCVIHICDVRGRKAKVGIEAAEHVNIIRGELEESTELSISNEGIYANDDAA